MVTFFGSVLSFNGSVLQHDGQIWSGIVTQALGSGPAAPWLPHIQLLLPKKCHGVTPSLSGAPWVNTRSLLIGADRYYGLIFAAKGGSTLIPGYGGCVDRNAV